jgi:hypothetical protein
MLSIRYDALRPLVYTVRDAGLFIYADRSAFKDWLETTRQVDAVRVLADPAARLGRLASLAKSLNADYLVFDFPATPAQIAALPLDLVWQNDTFTLARLR